MFAATSTASTKYTIRELAHGQLSELSVAAVDAAGLVSLKSDPLGVMVPADTSASTTPLAFGYTNLTSTGVSLRWDASFDDVGVTAYEIYRGDTSLGTTTKTNWTVTGLSTATDYTFCVRAIDLKGNTSAFTRSLPVTTPADSPSIAVKANLTSATFHLKWAGQSSNKTYANKENKPAGTYRLLWDGLKSGTVLIADGNYFVKIEATDRAGLKATPAATPLRIDRVLPAVKIFQVDKPVFKLLEDAEVTLKIYNAAHHLRHTITIGQRAKGKHAVTWDGKNNEGIYLPNQTYFFKLHLKDALQNEAAIDGGTVRLQREFS